jgi:oligopeptide/dipeptide ABC transporter ATP-binding protein
VSVRDLVKTFPVGGALRHGPGLRAVDGVSFDLAAGEVLALVGESGSGKTTLAECMLGLARPSGGRVCFEGRDLSTQDRQQRAEFRRRVQPIFQDPYSSLDPRWPIGRSVREFLDVHRAGDAASRRRRVTELLDTVGLAARHAEARPHELSGGQRQRACIAAALAGDPDLLVADEPVTALDVSVQAQVLNLLRTLHQERGLSILLIAHDLAVVEEISQRIAVMYLGRIVELGPSDAVMSGPRHPYTQALVQAIPRPDPQIRLVIGDLKGEIPSPLDPPSGCRFHPRCPQAIPSCRTNDQALRAIAPGHEAACQLA